MNDPTPHNVISKRFEALNELEKQAIYEVYQTASQRAEENMLPRIDPSAAASSGLGRVFFIKVGPTIIGYVVSLDECDELFRRLGDSEFRRSIRYSSEFIRDLHIMGPTCFLNQIVIHKDYRGKGLGKTLMQAIIKHYKDRNGLTIGCMIPEKNYETMNLFVRLGFIFLDPHAIPNDENLFFRGVRILNQDKFNRKINKEILPTAFKTIIPIQLHLVTHNVNQCARRMGAEVVISAVFQNEEILAEVYRMKKVYLGFFRLLTFFRDKEAYLEALEALKVQLKYYEGMENDTVASLSKGLDKKGFEMFIINDDPANHDFSSFASPLPIHIEELTIRKLMEIPEFQAGRSLSDQEKAELMHILYLKVNKKKPFSEEESQAWKSWQNRMQLSDSEIEALTDIVRGITTSQGKRNKPKRKELRKVLNEFKWKEMGEEEKEKWNFWINLQQTLFKYGQVVFKAGPFSDKPFYWCTAAIPMSFSGGNTSRIMFSIIAKREGDDPTYLNDLIYTLSNALAKNIFNITLKMRELYTESVQYRLFRSLVMARNVSHNIGSHILSALANERILQKELFTKLEGPKNVSSFAGYLRTRMDLIADISTADPVVSMPRNLKKDIIDKFNREHIALNYISGTDLNIAHIKFDSTEIEGDDVVVQVSNGEVGSHAVFTIFENIIRNSAKYEDARKLEGKNFFLTVKVKRGMPGARFHTIIIHDNIPRNQKGGHGEECLVSRINGDISQHRKAHPQKEWNRKAWGILEMLIAASYLQKIPADEFSNTHKDDTFFEALEVPVPHDPKQYYLGYELKLKKPREILLLGGKRGPSVERKDINYSKFGIRALPVSRVKENKVNIYSHNMVVCLGQVEREKVEDKKKFPLRWIYYGPEEGEAALNLLKSHPRAFIQNCWEKWVQAFLYMKGIQEQLEVVPIKNKEDVKRVHQKDPGKVMVFDFHGLLLQPTRHKSPDPQTFFFYEAFGSQSPTGISLRHLEKETALGKKRIMMELMEAASIEVIVLDERIQDNIFSRPSDISNSSLNYHQELDLMNIYIPDRSQIPLGSSRFDRHKGAKILDWVKATMEQKTIDFLVIHLGILERICGSTPQNIEDFIECHFASIASRPEIIITSGRGSPHFIPSNVLFLHYSNIARYLIHEKSKYHFSKTLFSARTRLPSYEKIPFSDFHVL